MLTCPRSSLSFHSNAHHHGSLPPAAWSGLGPAPESRSRGALPHLSRSFTTQISHSHWHAFTCVSAAHLVQKIEAVRGSVPVCVASSGDVCRDRNIADLPIFVRGCCELHSQKQAQLKVGTFEPQ